VLGVGIAVGAVSAFVTIWALMRILERVSAWPFVAYRALLGVALLAGAASGWLH
jgi:undecaprenyl-diphosphatase